jgi:hypothetical protein
MPLSRPNLQHANEMFGEELTEAATRIRSAASIFARSTGRPGCHMSMLVNSGSSPLSRVTPQLAGAIRSVPFWAPRPAALPRRAFTL